jgi:hypothetical protein
MSGTAVEEDSEICPFRVEAPEEELAELGKGGQELNLFTTELRAAFRSLR